jgi:type I restriction enzyme, S subunit
MSDLIPEGWSNTIFGELTESIKSGLSRRIVAQDIGIPVLISGNIQNNILDTNEFKYWYVNDPQGADTSRYLLNDGDILLCFINSMAQIGKVCIYRDIGRPAIYTTNLFRVVANPRCSPVFVYQLMTYQTFQEEIQLITKPAVNQASFTKGDLVEIPVKLPPLPEQQKIAAILSSVDEVIEKTQAQINKLKDLKTGMMQELLSPREGQAANTHITQGESKNGLHHTEFKDSPLGRIPVGWEVVSLGQTGKWSGGGTPSKANKGFWGGNIPWVSPKDMKVEFIDKTQDYITEEAVCNSSTNLVKKNSLLMVVRSGILQHTLPLAIAARDLTLNQDMKALSVTEGYSSEFIYNYLQANNHKVLRATLKAGNTVESIDFNEFTNFLIPCPPLNEQEYIVKAVGAVAKNLRLKSKQLINHKNIKKALMQDLLTGHVRVNIKN